ncbi:hypothetical protein ANN_05834 [Periplaneta americana]|uniref:Reverse transcriptase domain-containing protein n=1 Tax=Periplaneta americana TaxID=6978 RepID=A0ABQ8TEC6_PERAM|nr:hypothetical protein ANN_05834 [Periplaneta americana]
MKYDHFCFILILLLMTTIENIATLNINCLRSQGKQHLLREFIYDNDIDILFLQEVNIDNFDFLGARYSSVCNIGEEQRGTAIIYRAGYTIQQSEIHPSGRLTTVLMGDNTLLINLYLHSGSNRRQEREDFISRDVPYYLSQRYEKLIIGGDFNCVLHCKDQTGTYNPSLALDRLTNDLHLTDVWEKLRGNDVQFTFHQGNSSSRIDRFYINRTMQTFLRRIEVHPVPFSDHDCVLMVLSRIHNAPQIGRSYWKLNSKLICDEEVMNEFSSWWEMLSVRAERSKHTELRKWMYIYKPAIRSFFRNQGIIKAKDRKSKLQFYYNVIYDLYQQQCEGKDVTKHMNTVKIRLCKLQEDILKGSTVRCHTESIISGEKAALFHIACEKKRGQTKVMSSLLLKNKERTTSTTECLKEAERHFASVFCRENCSPDDQQILLNNIQNTITPDDQLRLEEDISETELKEAILTASSKSSPGPDGIDYNFYKKCWAYIKRPLLNVMNEIFKTSVECVGFNEGIIVLIPKIPKPQMITDYRPITLLNTDYKLFMKILANRIRPCMDHLIAPGQTCSVPGRTIINNLISIRDTIIQSSEMPMRKVAILNIDMEKAFDRVSQEYLFRVLEQFRFPRLIADSIQRLYRNAHSRIQINGYFTKPIPIQKSVRQGCPLSMILFTLCLEPLLRMIDRHLTLMPNPLGIPTVQAYADDISVICRNESQLGNLVDILTLYCNATNARVNYKKSALLPLGEWNPAISIAHIPVRFEARILGIIFSPRLDDIIENNWQSTLNKLRGTLHQHLSRNLNLLQKVWHVNTFALSKLWYLAQVLPMPDKVSQKIEQLIGYYVWRGYPFRVARPQLRRKITEGGLNLIFSLMLAGSEFQSLGRAIVKEDEYEEMRWDDNGKQLGEDKFFFINSVDNVRRGWMNANLCEYTPRKVKGPSCHVLYTENYDIICEDKFAIIRKSRPIYFRQNKTRNRGVVTYPRRAKPRMSLLPSLSAGIVLRHSVPFCEQQEFCSDFKQCVPYGLVCAESENASLFFVSRKDVLMKKNLNFSISIKSFHNDGLTVSHPPFDWPPRSPDLTTHVGSTTTSSEDDP